MEINTKLLCELADIATKHKKTSGHRSYAGLIKIDRDRAILTDGYSLLRVSNAGNFGHDCVRDCNVNETQASFPNWKSVIPEHFEAIESAELKAYFLELVMSVKASKNMLLCYNSLTKSFSVNHQSNLDTNLTTNFNPMLIQQYKTLLKGAKLESLFVAKDGSSIELHCTSPRCNFAILLCSLSKPK